MKTIEGIFIHSTKVEGYILREEILLGDTHIVVPVVMMVEGVHSGSGGPILHLAEELGRFPASWDGMPVVINHPVQNGINVSANSPTVLNKELIGRIFNTMMKGNKLTAEAWINEELIKTVSDAAYTAMKEGNPLEVSVGVFTDQEDEQGEWNGEEYIAIARNHRPDHLALLPGDTGACSWNDGCGVRTNKQIKMYEKTEILKAQEVLQTLGFVPAMGLQVNKEGYQARLDKIREAVYGWDAKDIYHYVEEVYDDSLIYRVIFNTQNKLYSQSYNIVDGAFTLVGEPKEVKKNVTIEFTPVVTANIVRTKFNSNKKQEVKMAKEDCGQCMEKVIALINNKATKFTAADREWLLNQEESVLDKLFPEEVAPVIVEKVVEKTVEALSAEDKEALTYGKKQLKERREMMAKAIQDNTSVETWPSEVLNAMNEEMLQRVYASVKKTSVEQHDYSLNGSTGVQVNAGELEAMYPAGLDVK